MENNNNKNYEDVSNTHKSAVITLLESTGKSTPDKDVVCRDCKHGIWRIQQEKAKRGLDNSSKLECYCKHLFQVTYVSEEYPFQVTACDGFDDSVPEEKK